MDPLTRLWFRPQYFNTRLETLPQYYLLSFSKLWYFSEEYLSFSLRYEVFIYEFFFNDRLFQNMMDPLQRLWFRPEDYLLQFQIIDSSSTLYFFKVMIFSEDYLTFLFRFEVSKNFPSKLETLLKYYGSSFEVMVSSLKLNLQIRDSYSILWIFFPSYRSFPNIIYHSL